MVFCLYSDNFLEEKVKYLDDFMIKRLKESIENENFIKKSSHLVTFEELRYFRISKFRFIFSQIGYNQFVFLSVMPRKKNYDNKQMGKIRKLLKKELRKIRK